MNGYADGDLAGQFGVGRTLTRAELAAIMFNWAGSDDAAGAPDAGFKDVSPDAWYADVVNWAAVHGIMHGYEDAGGNYTSFGPNDTVTREQVAAVLYNYATSLGLDTASDGAKLAAFEDSGLVSDWATDAMAWAVDEGIITGVDGRLLEPTRETLREEVAKMVYVSYDAVENGAPEDPDDEQDPDDADDPDDEQNPGDVEDPDDDVPSTDPDDPATEPGDPGTDEPGEEPGEPDVDDGTQAIIDRVEFSLWDESYNYFHEDPEIPHNASEVYEANMWYDANDPVEGDSVRLNMDALRAVLGDYDWDMVGIYTAYTINPEDDTMVGIDPDVVIDCKNIPDSISIPLHKVGEWQDETVTYTLAKMSLRLTPRNGQQMTIMNAHGNGDLDLAFEYVTGEYEELVPGQPLPSKMIVNLDPLADTETKHFVRYEIARIPHSDSLAALTWISKGQAASQDWADWVNHFGWGPTYYNEETGKWEIWYKYGFYEPVPNDGDAWESQEPGESPDYVSIVPDGPNQEAFRSASYCVLLVRAVWEDKAADVPEEPAGPQDPVAPEDPAEPESPSEDMQQPDEHTAFLQQWISDHLSADMTDKEKVMAIQRWVADETEYGNNLSFYEPDEDGRIGGDCYTGACFLKALCDELDIECQVRFAGNDLHDYDVSYGQSSSHWNTFVWIDGVKYLADCTPGTYIQLFDWSQVEKLA